MSEFQIICLDDSIHADYALEYYLDNVYKPGNTAVLCHCPEEWKTHGPMDGPSPAKLDELRKEAQGKADKIKAKAQQALDARGVQAEWRDKPDKPDKDPWHAIVNLARERNASLIVVGSRGQSKIRRTLLGSTSDSVLHHAHCPVLICKHPGEQTGKH